jgi:hypothetical protein
MVCLVYAVGPAHAVPHCSTVLYSSTAVSSVLCSMLCMSIPLAGGGWLVMADSGRFLARLGATYQSLPTVETKPKTNGSCMCLPLPNLTRFRARGAKPIGAFGLVPVPLPMLTISSIWLSRRSIVLLPIITGRGVKYTHNDIKHRILHPDSGPRGIRLIPTEHTQKEITVGDGGAKHRSIDPPTTWHNVADPHAVVTIHQGGPALLTPRPLRTTATAQILCAKQVNLVKNS